MSKVILDESIGESSVIISVRDKLYQSRDGELSHTM